MPVARAATIAPFPTDPVLIAIALAYRNDMLIADQVMPRVPVGQKEFKYMKMDKGERFTLPDDRVGRRGRVNATEQGWTEGVGQCVWHALDGEIPREDIKAGEAAGYDPVGHNVMVNRDLIALGREVRVANLVFNAANYATPNKETLAGNDRWSQPATSTPIADIEAGKDAMIMRPNIAVCGRKTWRYLSQHPSIVKAVNANDGDSGIARRRAVADLFELEDIYVGEGWVNTAKPGQAGAYTRVWGAHFALLHRNRNANTQGGTTFGYTAQMGTVLAGQWEDKLIGVEGGIRARTGECVGETIIANDLGYLFTNAGDDA